MAHSVTPLNNKKLPLKTFLNPPCLFQKWARKDFFSVAGLTGVSGAKSVGEISFFSKPNDVKTQSQTEARNKKEKG
jgi:hypothetical protein